MNDPLARLEKNIKVLSKAVVYKGLKCCETDLYVDGRYRCLQPMHSNHMDRVSTRRKHDNVHVALMSQFS